MSERRQGNGSRVAMQCLLAACIIATVSAARASPDLPSSRFADPDRKQKLLQALPAIEAMMSDAVTKLGGPGLSFAIVVDGEAVLVKGFGKRDIATGAPVDADTVFRIASMTKSFTALAILKLRDAGKLSLDDPVARYVPELRDWRPPTTDSGPITIRHLLSHTAGFPEDNPQGDRTLDLPLDAFANRLAAGIPFSTATGSEFEYSNLGFMILGSVITRVSGRPFQVYITDEILLPLGMKSTHWSVAKVPKEALALGYRKDKDAWIAEPMLEDGAGAAMGGMLSTSRDLTRFITLMLSAFPPRDDPEIPPALRRTLREMQAGLGFAEVLLYRELPGDPLIGRGFSYGFGLLSVRDCGWGREVQHAGGLPGFNSNMRWLPDHGVGVIVLANSTYTNTNASSLARSATTLLQNTGAMQARQATPSPALIGAARAVTDLIIDWNDERARALAAENLFLDESLEERRSSITGLRTGLGSCKLGKLDAENALRGKFRIDCETGWLNVALALAPLQPPRVQFLEVTGGKPPSTALKQSAKAVTDAIATGARDLRLDPKVKRQELAAVLQSTRLVHGSCRLGDAIDGDGATKAGFMLACDRGTLQLSLSAVDGRISDITLNQPSDVACLTY